MRRKIFKEKKFFSIFQNKKNQENFFKEKFESKNSKKISLKSYAFKISWLRENSDDFVFNQIFLDSQQKSRNK